MVTLRSFEFEAFPAEIRLKIYCYLLREDEKEIGPTRKNRINANILRCNKKIHEEAAVVLYNQNCFVSRLWAIPGEQIWHKLKSQRTCLPHHYSRLITKVHLRICILCHDDDDNVDSAWLFECFEVQEDDYSCDKLILNDLSSLTISFDENARRCCYETCEKGYISCLCKLRANKVCLVSPSRDHLVNIR